MKRSGRSETARAARAFTLIELLVAVTILAVVALLSWRGLDQVIRGRQAIAATLEEERLVTLFFDQLGRDARSVVDEGSVADSPVTLDSGELRLVRRLEVPGAAERLQVVRYRAAGTLLTRLASGPLSSTAQVHAALGGVSDSWNEHALGEPIAAASWRVFIANTGWTSNAAELATAVRANRAATPLVAGVVAPLARVVTGFEVAIVPAGSAHPLTRVVMVAQ